MSKAAKAARKSKGVGGGGGGGGGGGAGSMAPQPTTTLSAWNAASSWYASVLAQDHLDVYSTQPSSSSTPQLVASHDIRDTPTAICWATLPSVIAVPVQPESKKRRASSSRSTIQVVAVGLSNGQVDLFSPTHSRVLRVLQLPASADVQEQAIAAISASSTHVWATTTAGHLVAWDMASLSASDAPVQPTSTSIPDKAMAVRALVASDSNNLVANHVIHLVPSASSQPRQRFSAHSTPVTHLVWLDSRRFLSAAQDSRVVYLWATTSTTPIATLSIDSSAVSISPLAPLVSIVSTSGAHLVFSIPGTFAQASGSPTPLQPVTQILVLPRANAPHAEAYRQLDAGLSQTPEGGIVANVVRSALKRAAGSAVLMDEVAIRTSPTASIASPLIVVRSSVAPTSSTPGAPSAQRYSDPASRSGHRSGALDGAQVGEDGSVLLGSSLEQTSRAAGLRDTDADADALFDAAEPTLAHRLESLRVKRQGAKSSAPNGHVGGEDDEGASSDSSDDRPEDTVPGGPATLAATLLQALQSNDVSLLSSILSRGETALVNATVARLPSQAAPILLEACVQRLALGRSGRRGGARGDATLGARQAKACATWIRATLVRHAGFLMALPALVSRLSNLHQTLSARLASHERLLALQGRMELVLGQIEMRQDYVEAQRAAGTKVTAVQGVKPGKGRSAAAATSNGEGKRWVEQSDDEDEMDVDEQPESEDDVELADEEDDEVHEIGLGEEELDTDDDEEAPARARTKRQDAEQSESEQDDESEEDDSDEVDDESESDEDDEDADGLLDLEAEEGSEEDESEEEESD